MTTGDKFWCIRAQRLENEPCDHVDCVHERRRSTKAQAVSEDACFGTGSHKEAEMAARAYGSLGKTEIKL